MLEPRPININKLPKPQKLELTPVYNFFTPDERTSGYKDSVYTSNGETLNTEAMGSHPKTYYQKEGKVYEEETLKGQIPRYVQIDYDLPDGLTLSQDEGYDRNITNLSRPAIIDDAQIFSPYDTAVSFADIDCSKRITKKLDILAKLTPGHSNSSIYNETTAEYVINGIPWLHGPFDKVAVKNLINYNLETGVKEVNDVTVAPLPEPFNTSESSFINIKLDTTIFREVITSKPEKDLFYTTNYKRYLNENPQRFNQELPEDMTSLEDIELTSVSYDSDTSFKYYTKLVGCIIERFTNKDTILSDSPDEVFYIDTVTGGSFLDTNVMYGKVYYYTAKWVIAQVYFNSESQKIINFISSERSDASRVQIIDETPPKEPDGVFYRYNYANQSLMMTWQYPVGSQRDTKYYQIFRRKSIYDPFTCIAEIDFDNSFMKSLKREKVIESRIIKSEFPVNFYEDETFDKKETYIYAIAAVDAHGLTSGYSAQTRVSFEMSSNQLILDTVSQPGAPKQYPNFFVDPVQTRGFYTNNYTQDAIKASGFSSFNLYFDPDALKVDDGVADGVPFKHVFPVKGGSQGSNSAPSGVFKIMLMDLDRQKSQNLEIEIVDKRDTQILK